MECFPQSVGENKVLSSFHYCFKKLFLSALFFTSKTTVIHKPTCKEPGKGQSSIYLKIPAITVKDQHNRGKIPQRYQVLGKRHNKCRFTELFKVVHPHQSCCSFYTLKKQYYGKDQIWQSFPSCYYADKK